MTRLDDQLSLWVQVPKRVSIWVIILFQMAASEAVGDISKSLEFVRTTQT